MKRLIWLFLLITALLSGPASAEFTNFPNGVTSFGVPTVGGYQIPITKGTYFFVHSGTGSASNDGLSPSTPLATIDSAINKCTASAMDVIIVLPGHSETVTAAITADIAGISIIGLGEGLQRPSVTGNGTIDAITVTAANVTIANLYFPAPSTDDQTADINIAAAGCVVRDTLHIGSTTAKNKTDIITIAATGNDFILDGVRIYNVTVDVVGGISLEGACARGTIRNCVIQGTFSTAALMDEAAATLLTIRGNIIKNTKAATAVIDFTNNSTGVMSFNHVSGRHTTLASNITTGNAMDFFENRVVEEAAVNGAISPAADTD